MVRVCTASRGGSWLSSSWAPLCLPRPTPSHRWYLRLTDNEARQQGAGAPSHLGCLPRRESWLPRPVLPLVRFLALVEQTRISRIFRGGVTLGDSLKARPMSSTPGIQAVRASCLVGSPLAAATCPSLSWPLHQDAVPRARPSVGQLMLTFYDASARWPRG